MKGKRLVRVHQVVIRKSNGEFIEAWCPNAGDAMQRVKAAKESGLVAFTNERMVEPTAEGICQALELCPVRNSRREVNAV